MEYGRRVVLISLVAALMLPSAAAPQWTNTTSRDEITGAVSAFAISPRASPTEPMGFPYQGVQAWLAVACSATSEWVYVGFSQSPNLTGTQNGDGFEALTARVRWDDEVGTVAMRQDWGEPFLRFNRAPDAIEKIRAASVLLIEVPWYGEGPTYFRFSLAGSTAAIQRMACASGIDERAAARVEAQDAELRRQREASARRAAERAQRDSIAAAERAVRDSIAAARDSIDVAEAARADSIRRVVVYDPTLDPPAPEWGNAVVILNLRTYFPLVSNCWRAYLANGRVQFFRTPEEASAAGFRRSSFCTDEN